MTRGEHSFQGVKVETVLMRYGYRHGSEAVAAQRKEHRKKARIFDCDCVAGTRQGAEREIDTIDRAGRCDDFIQRKRGAVPRIAFRNLTAQINHPSRGAALHPKWRASRN